MTEQPNDEEIGRLLIDLREGGFDQRLAAAKALGQREGISQRAVIELKARAENDPALEVREAAQASLIKLGVVPANFYLLSEQRAQGRSNTAQFWVGFLVALLVNVVLMVIAGFFNFISVFEGQRPTNPVAILVNFLPLIAYIGILVALAFSSRRRYAFGALTALASLLALVLFAGPLGVYYCFSLPIVSQ
jgi:uncharacterized membrane protein YhaH (DUF805 family)